MRILSGLLLFSVLAFAQERRVNNGDVLRIEVWREPDLSRSITVGASGTFLYPLLGEVQGAGMTAEDIRRNLAERLREFVNDPDVKVAVDAGVAGAAQRVNPGDALNVEVWREPDLSKRVTVNSSGSFLYPLLGEVHAAGMTAEEVRQVLVERLREFVNTPEVRVTVDTGSK